jgi:aminoglycoside N3'-acetyltransferase
MSDNGFVQNINYVAGLDSKYGDVLKLHKSNVALGEVGYTMSTSISKYNSTDLVDETALVLSRAGVTFSTFSAYVGDIKVALEGMGYTVPVATVTDGINPIKILPVIASLGTGFGDDVKVLKPIAGDIEVVADNVIDTATLAASIKSGDIASVITNLAVIQSAALARNITINTVFLAAGEEGTAVYTPNTNTIDIGIPIGVRGPEGRTATYDMVYNATTGMLEWTLTGYVNVPSIEEPQEV